MEAIKNHTGQVVPLNMSNIDTDQIIPKQFLKRIERTGFGQFLFYNWRFDDDGNERSDFSMNDPKYEDASVLIAGDNFGCGSSREHAPWSILDYGYRVVIAPSFADIFYNNSLKNGIVPIAIDEVQVKQWLKEAEESELVLTVDLERQVITDGNNNEFSFEIPEYHRRNLINGWDEIALTLQKDDKITAYEQAVQ